MSRLSCQLEFPRALGEMLKKRGRSSVDCVSIWSCSITASFPKKGSKAEREHMLLCSHLALTYKI